MTRIRVDPSNLRQTALKLDAIANRLRALGKEANGITFQAPSFDGQFGPKARSLGAEAESRLASQAERIAALSEALQAKASAFEAVDHMTEGGFTSLLSAMRQWADNAVLFATFAESLHFPWQTVNRYLNLGMLTEDEPDEDDDGGPPWWLWIPPFTPIALVWWLIDQMSSPRTSLPPTATQTPILSPTATPAPTEISPSSTPTATEMPTATPTSIPGSIMYVTADLLNVRDSPGLNSTIVGTLAYRSVVELTGSQSEQDNYTWQSIESEGGLVGWVAEEFLSENQPDATGLDVAPLSGSGLMISGNDHGTEVDSGLHPGIDIWATDGTVHANTDGEVYYYQTWRDDEGWHTEAYDPDDTQDNDDLDGFGNYAVLESNVNGETYYQVYAHLESFEDDITQGQQVADGTAIGTMGSTGNSSGRHVHWEIRHEAAVTIGDDGIHNFSIFYPDSQEELDRLFVDPDDFAQMID